MRAVLITGPSIEHWKEVDLEPGLKPLQKAVGGYIEALPIDSGLASAYINEEGKLEDLPVYVIWCSAAGEVIDGICGPVVLLGPVNDEGENTELTDEALAYLKLALRPARKLPSIQVYSMSS